MTENDARATDESTTNEADEDSVADLFEGVSAAETADGTGAAGATPERNEAPAAGPTDSVASGPQHESSSDQEDPAAGTPHGEHEAHTGTLEPPQRSDHTEQGAFSVPNYAQDLIEFEFVLEAHDDFLPTGVNGRGMIVTGDREYVAIAEANPRSWSIHTGEKKGEIIDAYKSAFLATLDFPIQIVSYPTAFDISGHVDKLNAVMEGERTRSTDSTLVNIGRRIYPDWFDRFITQNDMKQRRFYIVVPISASQINQFQNTDSGLLDTAADKFGPLQPLADFFGSDTDADISKRQCLRELESRLDRVASGLKRLDVDVTRLDDRDAVMSVLYHYYNNQQPLNDAFPTGPYSVESEDAPVTNPLNAEER